MRFLMKKLADQYSYLASWPPEGSSRLSKKQLASGILYVGPKVAADFLVKQLSFLASRKIYEPPTDTAGFLVNASSFLGLQQDLLSKVSMETACFFEQQPRYLASSRLYMVLNVRVV